MDEKNSDFDEMMEQIINQTINGAISTIPDHITEVEQNKDLFQVKDPKEFVYGIIIGMALGIGGAVITAQKGVPSEEDQMKIRDMIFKNIPAIRAQIFR